MARVDITPSHGLRLGGYAARTDPSTGVADALAARAMVVSPDDEAEFGRTVVLVSYDGITVSSRMSVDLAQWLESKYRLPRAQLAICCTHSHSAPHLAGSLNNLFRELPSAEQVEATNEYTAFLETAIRQAIEKAMINRVPAQLSISEGRADFAINRRLLSQGKWTGFGEQQAGSVDHRLRFLQATSATGRLLGGAYMYACHCTTLGGGFNSISGDWAGLSASRLEQMHASSVFLPIIGCGADANPSPRGEYELALQHSAKIVDAVQGLISAGKGEQLTEVPVANFGYAGLAPEHPTTERLNELLGSNVPNEKRWAEKMFEIKKDMGRLPETYPMPIHTWRFGDALSWVFLGGEVVVDYQFQIEKELSSSSTWVAAYCDDVFAYVASEEMRQEGGYEVDSSMIYYLQPGRWSTGTESLILRRVSEISRGILTEGVESTAEQSLASIGVPEGFRVELVASEPLVQDPINIAFGLDGRVWIVEMSDYPLGSEGGGRVKWLRDSNGDGRLDEAHIFIEGLGYPTSVFPWQDGVLVIAAPNVLFARDRDGDGAADHREVLLEGIAEANPQHRASGFEIGLDGWLHFSAGDGTEHLLSKRNGQTYEVAGRDVAWNPTSGELRTTAGATQFVRARDAFGIWYGNSNSRPMYQYVIEDRYLQQSSVSGGGRQDLLSPPVAPPVFPRSNTLDRFNDLYARDRFTSACSSIVVRVPGLEMAGYPDNSTALVCEPVHNLVARIQLLDNGAAHAAVRHPSDIDFDFFASSQANARPVRAVNAPDGSVWILDMVRKVIEHPEWIPTAWQERLNLRSGESQGRIYRVFRSDFVPTSRPPLSSEATELLPALASENGAVRDLALQAIMNSTHADLIKDVRRMAWEHPHPTAAVRAAALGCLAAKGWLDSQDCQQMLSDPDPRVVRLTLEMLESLASRTSELDLAIADVPRRNLGREVDLQWILTSTLLNEFDGSSELAALAARCEFDPWILRALSLVHGEERVVAVVKPLLQLANADDATAEQYAQLEKTLESLWGRLSSKDQLALQSDQLPSSSTASDRPFQRSELLFLALSKQKGTANDALNAQVQDLVERAQVRLTSDAVPDQERLGLVNLIGSGLVGQDKQLNIARSILQKQASVAVKRAVIESLRRASKQEVADILLECWPEMTSSLRSAATTTLLTRREWVVALVDRLETGSIKQGDLDLSAVQQLRSYRDRDLRSRCIEVFSVPTARSEVVSEFLAKMPKPSANLVGEAIYKRECAQCHLAAAGKPAIGPPLENLGQWTLDQWVTAILDPNRNVEPKYLQSSILLNSGQAMNGLILSKNRQQLTLAASDGSVKELPMSEIEEIVNGNLSLMPEGFESKLSPQQLADLLAFLRGR